MAGRIASRRSLLQIARSTQLLRSHEAVVPSAIESISEFSALRHGDAAASTCSAAGTRGLSTAISKSPPGGGAVPGAFGDFVDIPTTQIRKIIGQRLMESKWGSPQFFAEAEADIDETLKVRKQLNEKWGTAISVNDFVVKAVAMALHQVPVANVYWDDKAGAILPNKSIDVSIAVATDKGLLTPIVKEANVKSLSEISKEIKDLVSRARAGKLAPHEFQGGSFSVSNLGMTGIDRFTAIINPPQSGILAVGRGKKVPVLMEDSDTPQLVTSMEFTLSADARAINADVAGQLLTAIAANLEDPFRLTL